MALQFEEVKQAQAGMSREDLAAEAQRLVPLNNAQTKQASPVFSAPITPTIDISSPTPSSNLSTPAPSTFDIQKLLNENQTRQDKLFADITGFYTPSPEEQAAQAQYAEYQKRINENLNQQDATQLSALAGIQKVEDQPIPMPFITGQQASIGRQANLALQTLGVQAGALSRSQQNALTVLQNAQANRGQKLEAAKFLYQVNQDNLATTLDIYLKTAPQNLSTQVDNSGFVQVITRNPISGEVSISQAGNTQVQTPFYKFDNDATVYAKNGTPITSQEEYVKMGGRGDFSDVTVLPVKRDAEEKALVLDLAKQYPDAFILPNDKLEVAQAKLANSRIYQDKVRGPVGSDSGVGPGKIVKFTPDESKRLIAAGFTNIEVGQIQNDVNTYGIEAVVLGMSAEKANAIRNVLQGITPTQEQAQQDEGKQFLSKDYLKNLYTTSQLEKAAAEAGFGDLGKGVFNLKDVNTEDYLNYLDGLITQYRQAGYNDQEILKMMQ